MALARRARRQGDALAAGLHALNAADAEDPGFVFVKRSQHIGYWSGFTMRWGPLMWRGAGPEWDLATSATTRWSEESRRENARGLPADGSGLQTALDDALLDSTTNLALTNALADLRKP